MILLMYPHSHNAKRFASRLQNRMVTRIATNLENYDRSMSFFSDSFPFYGDRVHLYANFSCESPASPCTWSGTLAYTVIDTNACVRRHGMCVCRRETPRASRLRRSVVFSISSMSKNRNLRAKIVHGGAL